MAYTNLLPRTQNITGASLTGVDGATDRTYTVPDVGILSSGFDIIVQGTPLHEGVGLDFTVSAGVITFLNAIDDADVIRINYFITTGASSAATLSTSTSLKYATPSMFAEMLGIKSDVPSWDVAGTPTNEAVGTGDNSQTVFYLDQQNILSDSYTFYANGVAMTETTHYTLDNDKGEITLTAAGVTLLDTNALTALYSYINNGMRNSYLIAVISRAEKEVDKSLNTTFTDGTATNPAYPSETEIQSTEGKQMDRWITTNKPLKDVESTLDGAITDSDTTISLATGDGTNFPSTGYIIVGNEVISYTGVASDDLTGCSRGVLGSTAAAHSDADAVHTTIVFISDTIENAVVTWTAQAWNTEIYTNNNGLVYRYKNANPDVLTRAGVQNRFKIIYLYGNDTVPGDITRLTLLFSKRMLAQDNVGKSMIAGRNEFRPEMFNVDLEEINRITGSHIVLPMGNT